MSDAGNTGNHPPRPWESPAASAPPPEPWGVGSQTAQPPRGPWDAGYQDSRPGVGNRQYANFGQRLVALIIDGLVVGIPTAILFGIWWAAAPKHYVSCTVNNEPGICHVPTGASIGVVVLLGLVWLVAVIGGYFGRMVGRTGRTLGNRAMGTQVVSLETGRPIGTGRAIGRYFGRILSGMFCYLGYLWMLWDKDRQTWHDKIVGSVVVKD